MIIIKKGGEDIVCDRVGGIDICENGGGATESRKIMKGKNTPLEKLVKIIGVILFFYFLWILLQRFAFYLLVNVVYSLFL